MQAYYLLFKVEQRGYEGFSMELEKMDIEHLIVASQMISEQIGGTPVSLLSYQKLEEVEGVSNYLVKGITADQEVVWIQCSVKGGIDSIEKVAEIKAFMQQQMELENVEVLGWEEVI